MARPATAVINLSAIRENFRFAQELAPYSRVMVIVKANAYGHGAVEVSRFLAPEADAFGVACIEEAIELRDAGIENPILLLEGFFEPEELDLIVEKDLWTVIHSEEQLAWISQAKLSSPITVWLKVDIGMHRLGISPDRYEAVRTMLEEMPQVCEVVSMGHFSSADDENQNVTAAQTERFKKLIPSNESPFSLANSAGCLAHSKASGTWQRPGIMLYGATPLKGHKPEHGNLKPAMTLNSEVIAVRDVPIGESVGYSATWTAARPSRIGTVAMGYADGFPRHAKTGTPVMVDGIETQIVGRVSMDMLAVDLTEILTAKVGSSVEFWGEDISANLVADWCDTIPYTLFTGITNRVHKRYIWETS